MNNFPQGPLSGPPPARVRSEAGGGGAEGKGRRAGERAAFLSKDKFRISMATPGSLESGAWWFCVCLCVCVDGKALCVEMSAFPGRALTGLFSTQVLGALLPGYTIRRVSV